MVSMLHQFFLLPSFVPPTSYPQLEALLYAYEEANGDSAQRIYTG